ncbi:universal stress protein [Blastococcus sp. TF02A-26]|uniref:universal stress protein n=1 Tax=Blastococcus sp. TF02A-26 TaxID=2250577 RepID=UPI000E120322|nr:universal stress protein [Blastococcus sp. TF02A-26]RBY80760.1 universal stress protein [Blastococcus sp. TF02A-26]
MTSAAPSSRPSAAGRVVVGVDGSEPSVRAAVYAAGLARRRRLPLLVVHVTPWATGDDALPLTSPDIAAEFLRSATRLVEAAAATVRDETGWDDVTAGVVDDHPVDGLVALSAEAELVVIGATGASGLPGLLLGSTAGGVVQHARCPVIALPGGAEPAGPDHGPVVAAVDGLPGQEEVLAFAAAEAAGRGARLDVVHAWRDVAVEVALGPYGGLVDWAEVEAGTRQELADLVAPVRERTPDLEIRELVVRDRTVPALREAGTGASLLVLGHRPRRLLPRLGSTTHGVLHRAPCPVAVVPLPEQAADGPAPA